MAIFVYSIGSWHDRSCWLSEDGEKMVEIPSDCIAGGELGGNSNIFPHSFRILMVTL